ncbi:cell wall-active antibiotics response protein LiaF [Oceanobacillus senegalensis]|uniref:cell wall-active antibiotics response protein LiaF n=1 Tax=Oceanobacillus senegalensis TaxID=1936063 RepID=UPI000A305295|nr:cell wall-active antibiotics response protein LiaF [Oceanobacillus senegalensis]
MFKRFQTDTFNWILIIGVILLIFEIIFFYGGSLINVIISAVFVFIGWKKFRKLWGKIVFWVFLVSFVFSVLNLLAVRFLIAAVLVLFIIDYSKKKKGEEYISPTLSGSEINQGTIMQMEPLFDHKWFGDQATTDTAYGWRDINIHSVFGDKVIDLSNTVLPNDTAVISIRHIMGKIEVFVPYEVEVSIHHSSVFGRAHIFGKHHWKLLNNSLLYQTENYDSAYPRVKIITSIFSGDIEVKRI